MDLSYISTFSALGGALIGGLTSFLTSWMTQHSQATTQRRATERSKREELYGSFIDEVSAMYAQALSDDHVDLAKLVGVYAKRGRIQLLASPAVGASAEQAVKFLLDVYMAPNRTPAEVKVMMQDVHMDPIKQFASVCRLELQEVTRGRIPV